MSETLYNNQTKTNNMKKLLMLPALLLATLFAFSQAPLDSRVVKNGCFSTRDAADVAAHHTVIMADEHIGDIIVTHNPDTGKYCS